MNPNLHFHTETEPRTRETLPATRKPERTGTKPWQNRRSRGSKVAPKNKSLGASGSFGGASARQSTRAIGRDLLAWYATHRRELPWRKSLDPYAVWVSEMMLQQTQVATVIPFFERWMRRFPDIAALAGAAESDVLHAWEGLGYYSRARNLRRAAQAMTELHEGRVPDRVEALLSLPGIGPYTAGAITSIAYGLPEPLVDGNVIRVLSRLFALRGDPNRAPLKATLWELARSLVPENAPGDFNQGLMEIGATVCKPRAPRCDACPLRSHCLAFAQGVQEQLPELPARAKPTAVHMVAAVVERGERVLVTKLKADAPRWSGMWLFPNGEVRRTETPEAATQRILTETTGLKSEVKGLVCAVRHTVTRFKITLDAYRVHRVKGTPETRTVAEIAWVQPAKLAELAMPKAHRKIASLLRDE